MNWRRGCSRRRTRPALRGDEALGHRLNEIAAGAGGPELINDDPATAPSKRLMRIWPEYVKTSDGPLAISDYGVYALKTACRHLASWLDQFEGHIR